MGASSKQGSHGQRRQPKATYINSDNQQRVRPPVPGPDVLVPARESGTAATARGTISSSLTPYVTRDTRCITAVTLRGQDLRGASLTSSRSSAGFRRSLVTCRLTRHGQTVLTAAISVSQGSGGGELSGSTAGRKETPDTDGWSQRTILGRGVITN